MYMVSQPACIPTSPKAVMEKVSEVNGSFEYSICITNVFLAACTQRPVSSDYWHLRPISKSNHELFK